MNFIPQEIWTCLTCGTEHQSPAVPRCKICGEPLCADCHAAHTKDHADEGENVAGKIGGFIALAIIAAIILSGLFF